MLCFNLISILILIPDEQMTFKTKVQKDELSEKPKERKGQDRSLRISVDTCRAQMSPIPETQTAHQTEDQTVSLVHFPLALFVSFPNSDLKFPLAL